eukprot:1145299-Prorocentrum_minimum.AAC.1
MRISFPPNVLAILGSAVRRSDAGRFPYVRTSRVCSQALMRGAMQGHLMVVQRLLAAGAQVDAFNDDRDCSLGLAAAAGHHQVKNEQVNTT